MMAVSLISITFLNWPHECHKFARDDPVGIAVFYALKVLVFFDIECLKIVPPKINSIFKSL